MTKSEAEKRKTIINKLLQHWDNNTEKSPDYFNNFDLTRLYDAIIEISNNREDYKVIKCTHIDGVIECTLKIDEEEFQCPTLFA